MMRSRCCARYELLISRSVRGSGELPAFLGAQRGVSELLHVAERMPHLDDGHVDVAGEQAYHDGVGVEQHRLAGGDEIQLPDHMEPVSYRVVQLLGEDHHGIIRMRLSHIMADEPEIGGRSVALATQAHNPTFARERAEEPLYIRSIIIRLVVDEALSVGDRKFAKKCRERVNSIIANENVTVLFVTHSTGTAKEFCHRGIVIQKGKAMFGGGIEEAVDFYTAS